MWSLIDFGEPDAWVVEKADENLVVLAPTQTVAGIAKEKIRFLIERSCNTDNPYLKYSFQGFFSLGEEPDFTGEYTFRFEINAFGEKCSIIAVADFSQSAYELLAGLRLARALCFTLPRNLIWYGALHDTEWVMEKWNEVILEDLEFFRPRLL